jgi:hypothetical protein
LPLRTINRLEEGATLLYRPVVRQGEVRRGDVTLVLVPANKIAADEKLIVLESKPAGKPEQWEVPWRVSVAAFVYGPAGLNSKRVRSFLSKDDELVAQLADYAEKTAQTEALITALSSSSTSTATVQSALQGFSSQYGLAQIDRTQSTNQQALTLLRAVNPTIASYDPLSPQPAQQVGQTASLATSVAILFFGSPIGLAASGASMLMQLGAMALPRTEFRSSFSQPMPNDGLGLCGKNNPAPPHTRVGFIWATRVPNMPPPDLSIEKANWLPAGVKSPLPLTISEADWKYLDRAHAWTLQAANGKPIPVKVQKLADKTIELELGPAVKPGKYQLAASWDWDRFAAKGDIEVRAVGDLASGHVMAESQDLLVAKTGKVPIALEGTDFEFVTRVEIEKVNDKFAAPVPIPFVLPEGPRRGPQDRMDVQVNTVDLDPGKYKLLITQVDGKAHPIGLKILPPPPQVDNLPVVLNQGLSKAEFVLKGQRLDLLRKLEVPKGVAQLGPARANQMERKVFLQMDTDIAAGTGLAIKAYIEDRSEPLTFADAVRIVGPRPRITEVRVSQPPGQDVQLKEGELPGGMYLSALLRVEHVQSNSSVRLACAEDGGVSVTLRLGERMGPSSFQQTTPDQAFLSFDTSAWVNGCVLGVAIANGSEGRSDFYKIGRIVRVPSVDRFEITTASTGNGECRASLTGRNLETIEKTGWSPDQGEAVPSLPLPAGDGQLQTLELNVPQPPAPGAPLYVWLRGETVARLTTLKP